MPAETDVNIAALKASGDAETQIVALITFKDGSKAHMSTKDMTIVIPGEPETRYYPYLKERLTSRTSLRKVTDGIDIEIQNVDQVIGRTVLATSFSLNGSKCIVYKVYIAPGGAYYLKEKVRGVIGVAKVVGSTSVTAKIIPDTNYRARGRGSRTMNEACDFAYKIDPRCGSTDPSPTCSHDYEGANGCKSKQPAPVLINPVPPNNGPSFGGLIGAQSATPISNPSGGTNQPPGVVTLPDGTVIFIPPGGRGPVIDDGGGIIGGRGGRYGDIPINIPMMGGL